MNATHKDLVKFENTSDSNYKSLRNRLASTVQQIRDEAQNTQSLPIDIELSTPPKSSASNASFPDPKPSLLETPLLSSKQMDAIGTYLGIDGPPQDILSSLDDKRLRGSCSWLSRKESFQGWRESLRIWKVDDCELCCRTLDGKSYLLLLLQGW